ncbi:MAG: FAD-binding protein [Thermoleophilia bacterium]|nr:FAD-binding protein [Thermoleophilia bacterium]
MPDLVLVAGAGLAGLAAAVSLHETGIDTMVVERRAHAGGASRESAGWIWRYTELDGYRSGAPSGGPALQQLVLDRFDDDVAWLEAHGVSVLEQGTGRAFTTGVRVDSQQAVDALVACLPPECVRYLTLLLDLRRHADGWSATLGGGDAEPGIAARVLDRDVRAGAVVLAGGGYAADTRCIAQEAGASRHAASRWSVRPHDGGDGSTLVAVSALDVPRSAPTDGECFTRLVPDADDAARERLLIPFGELGGLDDQRLLDAHGGEIERAAHDWSGAMQAWELARRTGSGWIELGTGALASSVHAGPVADIVAQAQRLGLDVQQATGVDGSPVVRMPVVAGLTHSRCGIVVGANAGVVGVPGLYAAGAEVADIGRGGTAGGLAQALVLGRVAAHSVIRAFAATTSD